MIDSDRYCHPVPKESTRGDIFAFTLVEMLVSMAILALIVLLMGRIFSDSSDAYKTGLKQSDQNLNGRVVLDYVARELRQAIIDENLVMSVQPSDTDLYDMGEGLNDWISFAAIGGDEREVELLTYYVRQDTQNIGGVDVVSYELMRGVTFKEDDINAAYKGSQWYDKKGNTARHIARNLSGFAIRLYDKEGDLLNDSSDSTIVTNLPAYADLYLGLMGDSDLVEAHLKGNTDNFIHKQEMIFMKRVYFRNRMGYNTGYGRDLYDRTSSDD